LQVQFLVANAAQALGVGRGTASGDCAKCLPPPKHLAQVKCRRVSGRQSDSRFFHYMFSLVSAQNERRQNSAY
jgi:hypothetical protein